MHKQKNNRHMSNIHEKHEVTFLFQNPVHIELLGLSRETGKGLEYGTDYDYPTGAH